MKRMGTIYQGSIIKCVNKAEKGDIMVNPKAVCDGGDLDCGSGLLLIIKKAMDPLLDGEILEVRSERGRLLMIYLLGVEW